MAKKNHPTPDLTDLQQQVAELTQALQHERADATNLRRRHDEQLASLTAVVKANVVRDLLPVIDNFERALKHQPAADGEHGAGSTEHGDKWVAGVVSILKQFEKTLADIGVVRIKTVGEPFDPRYHEAVSMEEGEGTTEIISEELQPGYTLGNEVIRHAMVRVRLDNPAA